MAGLDWLVARPVAHRGFHDRAAGRVENTLTAAEAAIARNFSIECDVQLTADDVPVVFHDDELDRLTGRTGPVHQATLAEIRAAGLRDTTDVVPTLTEFLDAIGGRVPVVIELKHQTTRKGRLEELAAKTLAGYRGPVALMSFDPHMMKAMARLAPDLPRGLTADRADGPEYAKLSAAERFALRNLLAIPVVGARFVAYSVEALPATAPLMARHLGLRLLTWTVRTPAAREIARRYADQMIFEGFDPEPLSTASAPPA